MWAPRQPPGPAPSSLRIAAALLLALGVAACRGKDQPTGAIEGARVPEASVRAREAAQQTAARALAPPRGAPTGLVLFGDLHVHTTYSIDAFLFSLPIFGGEGTHPPADACDFARYCSQLDFFSLNDHAEGLTPEHWRETLESLRQCNARAGDPADPDLVAFAGWEWTQVGATPETHWGHKNVIFPGLADDELPARPIAAAGGGAAANLFAGLSLARRLRWFDPLGFVDYTDFAWLLERLSDLPACPPGVDTRALPPDCREAAATPQELFEKLHQWGFPTLVIPHGTTWGFYTPPGTSIDKQLTREQDDPELQRLVEVYSGHGNSEQYRPTRAALLEADGSAVCPEPSASFLPCCWQAGEIMRSRCGELPADECEARVEEARRLAVAAGARFPELFPDAEPQEWLDCDQCRDCFKPSLSLRPLESIQYALSLARPDEPGSGGPLRRFRWGFISSSDNHGARPGTGYKQILRHVMTDANGVRSPFYAALARRARGSGERDRARPPSAEARGFLSVDAERVTSFLYPGGLVAVHAAGRSRQQIWDALVRREVYGTSGPRILLWFDLLNGSHGRQPMGSEAALSEPPRFEVRAVGALAQRRGCPAASIAGLGPDRLERLCGGECYFPGEERVPIEAIEIVRIRPGAAPGEDPGARIEDPWLRHECGGDPKGCVLRFEDPELAGSGQDAVYYARAVQAPTPAINGANLRTRFDAQGRAVSTDPCFGDYRTPASDDCLAPVSERAWSSPIYIDAAGPAVASPDRVR